MNEAALPLEDDADRWLRENDMVLGANPQQERSDRRQDRLLSHMPGSGPTSGAYPRLTAKYGQAMRRNTAGHKWMAYGYFRGKKS